MKKLLLVVALAAFGFSSTATVAKPYYGYKKPVKVYKYKKHRVHKSHRAKRLALRKYKARKMRLHHPRRYR